MWLIGAGGASLIALTTSAQIYLSMLHHGHSFVRLAAWQLCSWSVWAAATPVVLRLGARLSDPSQRMPRRTLTITVTALVIMAAHVVTASLATVWIQPYVPVQIFRFGGALILQVISVPADLLVYGILLLIGSTAAVYHRARDLEIRESRLEADLARAQLDALRLEIEPHFLFNTLNSIASLIRSRASDRALSMLLGLSDLLRATVDGTRQHTSTLGEEAAFVKRYIELQRARFSDRLDVQYAISPESESCAVPAFLLQPLVENAFGTALRSEPAAVVWSWPRRWTRVSCTSGSVTTAPGCRRTSASPTTQVRACATRGCGSSASTTARRSFSSNLPTAVEPSPTSDSRHTPDLSPIRSRINDHVPRAGR